ncbi:MAG: arginine--tRNA ligase [archaeon]
MVLPSYKEKLAACIDALVVKTGATSPGKESLLSQITIPPSVDKGNLSIAVFKFMPKGENPTTFAQKLVWQFKGDSDFEKLEATGPYINAFISPAVLNPTILTEASNAPSVPGPNAPFVIVEYASPNTNKPLHVGHLRNISLAESMIRLLEHEGNKVFRTQIINNRGVHICKSMLAYQKWGEGKTPQSEKMKPDHFVGKYYQLFSKRAEMDEKLEEEAQHMLLKWEQNDGDVRALWKKMNAWVEEGWKDTFSKLGATFDKNYYESEIYMHGKEIVQQGLDKGLFVKADNGAIIAPLEKKYKLPDKPLLRGDGTSLYFTQDMYLAMKRFEDYPQTDRIIYIVGAEQEMHFKQLFAILDMLGFTQAKKCYHLGYNLLVLPSGKMSARAGTVVDADELINELTQLAKDEYTKRSPEMNPTEIARRSAVIGMAALKFFMVKQDAKKEIIFNPAESISFEGQTGPYLLYANARAQSMLKKSLRKPSIEKAGLLTETREKELLSLLSRKSEIISSALAHYSPHVLAYYLLELANTFNTYYHEVKVIQENPDLEDARLALVKAFHDVMEEGLFLLGIETLKEM